MPFPFVRVFSFTRSYFLEVYFRSSVSCCRLAFGFIPSFQTPVTNCNSFSIIAEKHDVSSSKHGFINWSDSNYFRKHFMKLSSDHFHQNIKSHFKAEKSNLLAFRRRCCQDCLPSFSCCCIGFFDWSCITHDRWTFKDAVILSTTRSRTRSFCRMDFEKKPFSKED